MRKLTAIPTDKRCPKCGRTLPAMAFGCRLGTFVLRAYCREGSNSVNRAKYRMPKARHVNGEVFRRADGKLWEYTGAHWRRYWSPQMVSDLRRYYGEMTNEELAAMLDIPLGSLNRKARELGLHKPKMYRAEIARRHLVLARAESAVHGNSGQIKPGEHRGRETEFRKVNRNQ